MSTASVGDPFTDSNWTDIGDMAKSFSSQYYGYVAERKAARIRDSDADAQRVLADLEGATLYVAFYGHDLYEGDAFVLYEKEGTLYEVNASHCSCNGLEEQWDPEPTSWAALLARPRIGNDAIPASVVSIVHAWAQARAEPS